jgi:arylsulfatase A-like enzyme
MRNFRALSCVFIMVAWVVACAASEAFAQEMPPDQRPNILFAIADDASFPHFSAYGTDWVQTPAFDRVAEAGLLFTRAYTPNAKCAPSRAAILTGRNSWQLDEAANHWPYFPETFITYAEALGQHGYHVGHTGKGWAPGIAEANGQPRHLAGRPFEAHTADPPAEHVSGIDYARNFAAFLDEKPDEQPFCFWYGGYEPHRAYEYGVGRRVAGKALHEIDRVPDFWPDTDTVRTDMLDYAFEIEHFDRHLGRMLAALEEQGELDNTLVVVTSDNGMPFPRVKGQAYELSNHMPLAIMWGDGITNPGRVIDDHVSFIDLAPTFLEVAGLSRQAAGMQPITGRSLTDIFAARHGGQVDPARDHVLIGKERHDIGRPEDRGYPIRGLVTDEYLYLRNFEPDRWPAGPPETGYLNTDGSPTKTAVIDARHHVATLKYWRWSFGKRPAEELYHLGSDPATVINLADRPAYQERKRQLRAQLFRALRAQDDPRMFGRGTVFDDYAYADTSNQNFYERYTRGELNPSDAGWVNPSDFEASFPDSLR